METLLLYLFDPSQINAILVNKILASNRNKFLTWELRSPIAAGLGWNLKSKALCHWIVSSKRLPETIAYVRITGQSWQQGKIEGEVRAGDYDWQFEWCFKQGKLSVWPSLGRALIQEPLGRFLEQSDYQLEPGGDYAFTIRADF